MSTNSTTTAAVTHSSRITEKKKGLIKTIRSFLVQLVKNTAVTSIVGFHELTKAGNVINNATFQPFITYSLVALIYFAMCFPLTFWSRRLERRLTPTGHR